MMKRELVLLFPVLLLLCSFQRKEKIPVDLLIDHARIYTVDKQFSMAEAMVIKDGKIVATGTSKALNDAYAPAEIVDAKNQFVYPGFIDAHAHFFGYADGLRAVNLVGTKSWQECLSRIEDFLNSHPAGKGKWIVGRGWDQNDWSIKEFPNNEELNRRYPQNPVILERVDGHAIIANAQALSLASIHAGDRLEGGDIQVNNGVLTGILVDNATALVTSKMPVPGPDELQASLMQAQANCFAKGLTTIDDCGLDSGAVDLIQSLHSKRLLKMRMYVMLSDNPANMTFIQHHGAIKTERLNVRSMKVYADGALGSRGACLLHPYSDKPDQTGFLLSKKEHFDSVAAFLVKAKFQMCTHAIGDSGNRIILNTYGKYLEKGNDLRWRIEHAQVVNEQDFDLFGKSSIIPSVQPTHATSDMYWASDRLGAKRVKSAYAYRQLLEQNGWIPLGTDFPVEDIDPFKTFYAAVFRKDAKGYPATGFQVNNALTREQALRGMTIWAAKSNFEEQEKGSLEVGKLADFIIVDTDLMKAAATKILKSTVLKTYINGELVFQQTTKQ